MWHINLPRAGRSGPFGRGAAVLVAVSFVVMGPGSVAPVPAQPDLALVASTEVTSNILALAADKEASIKEKQQNVVADTCDALDALSGVMEPADFERHQAQCTVAKRAASSVSTDDIRAATIKRGASATVYAEYTGPNRNVPPTEGAPVPPWAPGEPTLEGVPYLGSAYAEDGDGDGICNPKGPAAAPEVGAAPSGHGQRLNKYTEWCAEAIGDGIGDDDGFCEIQSQHGKDRQEACVTVAATLTGSEENLDLGRLDDYDQLLDDADTAAKAVRTAAVEAAAARSAQQSVKAASSDKACPANQDRLGVFGIFWMAYLKGSADALEGVANTIGAFFDQTVVVLGEGGNTSAAGSVLHGVASAVRVTATALEETADVDTATNVTSTLECLSDFRAESDKAMTELSEDVAGLAKVELGVVELKDKSAYLITASVSGRPVSGVELAGVLVSTRSPLAFQALPAGSFTFAESTGAPGTYELRLSLPSGLSNVALFLLDVRYQGPDGPVYGHAVYERPAGS